MAIITQSPLGQFSGRLGSLIFSKNQNGNYVKSYVVGTDAKSLAQIAMRQRFSVMATHWRALSAEQKKQWKDFALTNFVPKHPRQNTIYSGYEAFVSLNTMLAGVYASGFSGRLINPSVDAVYTDLPPVNYSAPVNSINSQIQDSSSNGIFLNLSSASFVSSTGVLDFNLSMCPAVQLNPVIFKTPIFNTLLGFAVYFSMPFGGGRVTVSSKEAYMVGSVGNIHIDSGWVTSNDLGFRIETDPAYFSKCKYAFNVGSHIFVTVYSVSNFGQAFFLGRQLVLIS